MAGRAKIIETTLAWLLAGLFFYAGVVKFLQPAAFLVDILSFHLLSFSLACGVAYYLPALEIAAAVGLCWPRFRLEACGVLIFLSLIFLAALASAWARGLDISCGCFGKSEIKANYPLLIGRDLVILAACAVIFYFRSKATRKNTPERENGLNRR